MQSRWRIVLGIIVGLILSAVAVSAEPLTNESALFKWTPTTDPNIRYEMRWNNFSHPEWMTISTDLDSTLGQLTFTFPAPLPNSEGDRYLCYDMRAHWKATPTENSKWASETTTAGCNQVPLAVIPPPPPPTGLQVVSATPEQIIITAKALDCPRVITSTKGSTSLVLKRTVTCVK